MNAVGSPRPTWRELDDEAMRGVLVVDSRESVGIAVEDLATARLVYDAVRASDDERE